MIELTHECVDISHAAKILAETALLRHDTVAMQYNGILLIVYPNATEQQVYAAWCHEAHKRAMARQICPTADELEAIARRLRTEAERVVATNVVVTPCGPVVEIPEDLGA